MDFVTILLVGGIALAVGYFLRGTIGKKSLDAATQQADKVVAEAKTRVREIELAAKEEANKITTEAKKDEKSRRDQISKLEQHLVKREEDLDSKSKALESKGESLSVKEKEMAALEEKIGAEIEKQKEKLSAVAKLSREEARQQLLEAVEKEHKAELVQLIHKIEMEAKESADEKAREIIVTVMDRIASEQTTEHIVYSVQIKSEDMKGRIIGKEGRNIQAFEKITGADIVIDDSPDTVVVSCFDPVRRYVAKRVLETLVSDGRIHPTRIEQLHQKISDEVAVEIKKEAELALAELGITGVHPDLIKILGRLKFRTSYGQNILRHTVEATHIGMMLAKELGANVETVKFGCLLHDVGKALDQETGGSHVEAGMQIAKKYGFSEAVIHAIAAHHGEPEPETAEDFIVRVADAISGARPGARRDTLENYIKRLRDLEAIAGSFPGVGKAFAVQAGREVRIMVMPTEVDDLGAIKLSKEIATKIEKEMTYPGTIKVNVIRETRAESVAK